MIYYSNRIPFLFVLMVLIFFIGCSEDNSTSPTKPVFAPGTAVIGSKGGVIVITDTTNALCGIRLEIPAGALTKSDTISIKGVEYPPKPPVGKSIFSYSIIIEPADLTFLKPCKLIIPYDPSESPSDTSLMLVSYNEDTDEWLYLPSYQNEQTNKIEGEITQTSLFQLMYGYYHENTNITWHLNNYPTNLSGYSEQQVHDAVNRAFANWDDELGKKGIYLVESEDIEVDIKIIWTDSGFSSTIPFSNSYDYVSHLIWDRQNNKTITCYDKLEFDSGKVQLQWAAPAENVHSLGNNEIDIEDYITHEVGHTLGLNHFGSDNFSSIMFSQWSSGEVLHGLGQEILEALNIWYQVPEYMPYRIGNEWSYVGEVILDGEVMAPLTRSYSIVDTFTYEGERWFVDNSTNFMIIRDGEWWFWGASKDYPDLRAKYPIEVGDQWIMNIDKHNDTTYIKVEEKDVLVETPAGTFNCYKLSVFCPTCNDVWIYHYRWFNPAVGDVKTEEKFKHSGDYKVIYHLSDYNYKD